MFDLKETLHKIWDWLRPRILFNPLEKIDRTIRWHISSESTNVTSSFYTVEFKSIDQDSEIIALGEKIIMKGLWRKNKSSGKHLHKRICLVSITFSIIYKNINSILKCLQISMLRSFDLALMS